MKAITTKIKNDLYHVFVKGDSDKVAQARVFAVLAVPFFAVLFAFGQALVY
ncbi:hypothetical protein [Mucilaginibacter glaciei]|uniref:Uncharacterized protein n=1 Tax=Mucilaginibacter glaciei TaxID=2772109 RepID=A0A926NR60_9SPHI|nr:hypothetical protein [Mucilaginibacter glaciei]MBD1394501.1 hypothetical protein [Mucilaginibacter glaciei]